MSVQRWPAFDGRQLDFNALEAGKHGSDSCRSLNVRWTPHPVIATIRENGKYISVLL